MITGDPSYRDLNRENVLDIFNAAKYLKIRGNVFILSQKKEHLYIVELIKINFYFATLLENRFYRPWNASISFNNWNI